MLLRLSCHSQAAGARQHAPWESSCLQTATACHSGRQHLPLAGCRLSRDEAVGELAGDKWNNKTKSAVQEKVGGGIFVRHGREHRE